MSKIFVSSVLKPFPLGKGFRIGLLLFIFSCTFCKAQWVTIPDANFRTWLFTHGFSSCISGTMMDTTCNAVVNATSVNCSNQNISDLTGIQYFKLLTSLYCYGNSLTNLPTLPNSLNYLSCTSNSLTSLPTLPNSLNWLYCSNNLLTSLPALPNYLSKLYCSYCSLTSLPTLPNSLTELFCSDNLLTSLPSLPPSLSYFEIQNNPGIMCMPSLYNYAGPSWAFNISGTGITCLPNVITHNGYIAAIDTMPICTCDYPSGIGTSNITSSSAKVLWNTECCSQFQIQYRVTGTTTWTTKSAGATLVSKTLTALASGTTYDLRERVKCMNGTSYSSWSPIQTFTTLVSCNAPTGIFISNLTQTNATINWSPAANAYSYKLVKRKQGTAAWSTYTILAPTTFKTLTGLTNNTTYEYRLQTICNSSGLPASSWTAINTFTTLLRLEDESNSEIYFSLSPNPVSNSLTITSNFSSCDIIEIKDLLGRTLISKTTNHELPTTNYALDVSTLPSALYFISIRSKDGSEVVREFVKE